MAEQRNQAPFLTDDDPITPIDFTPMNVERRRLRLPLSPAGLAVSAALALFLGVSWFVLTARSVSFTLTPPESKVAVTGALVVEVGPRYLIRQGDIRVHATAPGYYDFDSVLSVGDAQTQSFAIDLQALPGYLSLDTGAVSGAEIFADGALAGVTPLEHLELTAGEHTLTLHHARYETLETTIDIAGRAATQTLSLNLLPAWATLSVDTTPPGAMLSIDGIDIGTTPLATEVLEGEREIMLKLPAHKAWTTSLTVTARQDLSIQPITLEPANGLVTLRSSPRGASVTIDGTYHGQTPLEVSLPPGSEHKVVFFLNGYQEATRRFSAKAAEENTLDVTLDPILSSVKITATPADAELYINGERRGNANQTLSLLAASQTIEVRKAGYAPYTTTFISRPGLEQELNIALKTLEQQRIESIKPEITANGQIFKLIYPSAFIMGASRREAGRQANEVLRNVKLTKPFYLSTTEVSNAQYKAFDPTHNSGTVQGQTLNNPNQPVARVRWIDAVRYCNWLSEQEKLKPFYMIAGDSVTGIDAASQGYRLPTEAEWEWAARVDGDPASLLRFPWGAELPPPPNQGNYADISAGNFLGRVLANYDDGFMVSAPVASFAANANGFYDMGGNVAEWVHDYYGTATANGAASETDPLGPSTGAYHVIRGSSWAQGSVTELRLSFRDYNNEARDDVGFRVARYLGQ
ncbi:MAG: PEGA domain-containing protein [Pseudomonadales bacterium]|jgi:formylglycine-generating enzyme required for sulfatase activity|nr:PEGA domain-containing protein [Pseudomonadales bacterium]